MAEKSSVQAKSVEEITYGWPLDAGFPTGSMIQIDGLTHLDGKKFEINFALGSKYLLSDIALHSSVRFAEGVLVNNSFDVNKRWVEEERYSYLPIAPGESFQILIYCLEDYFNIAINNKHFCNFNHRLSYKDIKHLDIRGDVTVTLISYIDNTTQEPTVYSWPLINGLTAGRMVKIDGLAHLDGIRFDINFSLGPKPLQDKIAFHASVRYAGENLVNNSFDKAWKKEEIHKHLPIAPGQRFQILILCLEEKFMMAINGKHFCDFSHRFPYSDIKHLEIRGSVTLTLLSYEDDTTKQSSNNKYPVSS